MWLRMNLDGITVSLQINGYKKVADDDYDSTWCKTDFSFVSDGWLNYRKENDEVFLAREIDDLAKALSDLLNDRLDKPTEFGCIEPDFNFVLNPKRDLRHDPKVLYIKSGHEIVDVDMEWKISFWHEGLTGNYLSVSLGRAEIEYMLIYLRLVMGELTESDQKVKHLMEQAIISRE